MLRPVVQRDTSTGDASLLHPKVCPSVPVTGHAAAPGSRRRSMLDHAEPSVAPEGPHARSVVRTRTDEPGSIGAAAGNGVLSRLLAAGVLQRHCADEQTDVRVYPDLRQDPDKTGKIDRNSTREAEVAAKLAQAGLLRNPVRPNTRNKGDFIEDGGRGRHWDVKAYRSWAASKPTLGVFNFDAHVAQMEKIITTKYGKDPAMPGGIILDAVNLDGDHRTQLRDEITKRGWKNDAIWHEAD